MFNSLRQRIARAIAPDSSSRNLRVALPIRGRYDTAQTTTANSRHWAAADSLSADAAASAGVRKTLRERARYEVANNAYARGLVHTVANAIVGTGPTLQLNVEQAEQAVEVEMDFARWAQSIDLPQLLRTARMSQCESGEVFIRLRDIMDLDLVLYEADHCQGPYDDSAGREGVVDGVEVDRLNRPRRYFLLDRHPGGDSFLPAYGSGAWYPAEDIIHLFRPERPWQTRGIPEITAALDLFAMLRRFTSATLTAAENIADLSIAVQTTLLPGGEAAAVGDSEDGYSSLETMPLERGMMNFMPEGWTIQPIDPKQPAATYADFKREILAEIGRVTLLPINLLTGDSSDHNFASGRLDHLIFNRWVDVERTQMARLVLDRILERWLRSNYPAFRGMPHTWMWPGIEPIDAEKQAKADAAMLEANTVTLAEVYARKGQDWEQQLRQRAREKALMQQLMPEAPAPREQANDEADAEARAALGIEASAPEGEFKLTATDITLQAAGEGEKKQRRFEMVAYTGAALRLPNFPAPVVVDLGGFDLSRQTLPIVLNHNRDDLDAVLGQTDRIEVRDGQLVAEGVIFANEHTQRVLDLADQGLAWQASIGGNPKQIQTIRAGDSATVNGRKLSGPAYITRKTELREISFVLIGADADTSARIAASQQKGTPMDPKLRAWIEAQGFDPDTLSDDQAKNLKAMYHRESGKTEDEPKNRRRQPEGLQRYQAEAKRLKAIEAAATEVLEEDATLYDEVIELRDKAREEEWTEHDFRRRLSMLRDERNVRAPKRDRIDAKVYEAALCATAGLLDIEKHFDEKTLNRADDQWPQGLGLNEFLVRAAQPNGYRGVTANNVRDVLRHIYLPGAFGVQAAGFSSHDLVSGVLSATANKFLAEAFNAVEGTFRRISAKRSVRNFHTHTIYTLVGDFTYQKLGPGEKIEHAKADDDNFTISADTYARMFAITYQDIVNDDLGAISDVPRKLGRGAGLALNTVFWTAFLDHDTYPFPSADTYNNYIGNYPLSISSLKTGYTKFRKQTDPDGNLMGLEPQILLVPPDLFALARQLTNSTEVRQVSDGGGSGTLTEYAVANPFAGRFNVESSAYLTDTTEWYLIANPAELSLIEIAYLNGRETPMVDSADADFNTLGIQMRGVHNFGVAFSNHEAGMKSNGA